MRLLDSIAQSTTPFVVQQNTGERWRLSSACDFAARLQECPLRYVLADELTRTCMALAYSEGDRLASCLDLVHVPAQRLWIEWNDAPRRAEIFRAFPEYKHLATCTVLRAGALISASRTGRSGVMRTFFNHTERQEDPMVAAIETHFDFDGNLAESAGINELFEGAVAKIPAGTNNGLEDLLGCAGFRFDDPWRRYYQATAVSTAHRHEVARLALGTVAFDLPMLVALFLLLGTHEGLSLMPSGLGKLNVKRGRNGKHYLLEHIEVRAPLFSDAVRCGVLSEHTLRAFPRRHHVRGHLVRRGNTVFWRAPHYRGHVRLGSVRSRTVTLDSAPPPRQAGQTSERPGGSHPP